MRSLVCLFSFALFSTFLFSQYNEKRITLASELNEISGITLFNDSILIAINDSGNSSEIYFLNLNGIIIHKSQIANATNIDWEDLYFDPITQNLYIGDFGNNLNQRKDLCVYKIHIDSNWRNESLISEKISFSYSNQFSFPPSSGLLDFDCEAMFISNDSIHLITKSSANPWKGFSNIYTIPALPGNHSARLKDSLFIGNKGWQHDAVTSCSYFNNSISVLTYRKIMVFDNNSVFSHKSTYCFDNMKQREGICRLNENTFLIAAEKNKLLGGPFLYILTKEQ